GEARLRVRIPFRERPARGDSLGVDGVCLTVTASGPGWIEALASPETMGRTTLGLRRRGDRVNLERPLRAGARLGGHLVQGHVDDVGVVEEVVAEGSGTRARIAFPPPLSPCIVPKGSIAVDGVSLTVAARDGRVFEVALIPSTLEATTLGAAAPGTPVNLEVDLLGRYVVEFLKEARWRDAAPPVTLADLVRHGFVASTREVGS
ncbi:MAG: riboflavin synthase, partial [Candidatus Polarisedimenticolia bacterium]